MVMLKENLEELSTKMEYETIIYYGINKTNNIIEMSTNAYRYCKIFQ